MPVPTLIGDLSQTAASNYPAGSDSPAILDDVQRAHAAFIAQLRDGKGIANSVTLASATTTDIGGQNSQFVEISGTTTITSLGSTYNGPRFLRFTGILTLTYNASTLTLPTAASITTAAGDAAIAVPNAALSGWNIIFYQRSNGVSDFLNTPRIDVASATTTDLTAIAPSTRNINIRVTTTITGFTVAIGQLYFVRFNAALTLTNNASIITQTGANITTDDGATCILRATAGNTVEVLSYVPGAGTVSLSGDQTIAGVKTFSTQPILPQAPVLGTAVATTSGTSIDFTGIPPWVNKIVATWAGGSTNGASNVVWRVGTSGGIVATGYSGASVLNISGATSTGVALSTGIEVPSSSGAADVWQMVLVATRNTGNTWSFSLTYALNGTARSGSATGSIALGGALDRIRLTAVNGTDAFDAGSINILYE